MSKESTCSAGDAGDASSILVLGRSLGGGHGNPLQYSCLGNPKDRGAWRATVHGVTKGLDMTEQLNNKLLNTKIITFSIRGSIGRLSCNT